MPDADILGEYRGKPIINPTGKFTNMGDGLSKAMKIEGGADEPGTIVTFVIACRVGPHTLTLSEDEDSYELMMKYVGGTVAKIDADLVRGVLVEMERRVKEMEDAEARAATLPGVDDAASEAAATTEDPSGLKGKSKGKGHLTTVEDEDGFHDETANPGAPNDLVGAGIGSTDTA